MKKIKNIEPFNDFWYFDCFLQNVIPIVSHYNGTNEIFIKNDRVIYEIIENSLSGLNIDLISRRFLPQFLQNINFKYIELSWRPHIIEFLINSIDCAVPTICSIDCFYEKQRIDSYNLKHLAHTILVYGYDLDERNFIILEHDYVNGLCFREKNIDFDELIQCMKGYADYRPKDSMIQIVPDVYGVKSDIIVDCDDLNKNKFWKIVKQAIYSLQYENCDKLIKLLSNFSNCKKVMMYSLNEILDNNESLKSAGILMALIAKFKYTKILKEDTLIYCKNLIDKIEFMETA